MSLRRAALAYQLGNPLMGDTKEHAGIANGDAGRLVLALDAFLVAGPADDALRGQSWWLEPLT